MDADNKTAKQKGKLKMDWGFWFSMTTCAVACAAFCYLWKTNHVWIP